MGNKIINCFMVLLIVFGFILGLPHKAHAGTEENLYIAYEKVFMEIPCSEIIFINHTEDDEIQIGYKKPNQERTAFRIVFLDSEGNIKHDIEVNSKNMSGDILNAKFLDAKPYNGGFITLWDKIKVSGYYNNNYSLELWMAILDKNGNVILASKIGDTVNERGGVLSAQSGKIYVLDNNEFVAYAELSYSYYPLLITWIQIVKFDQTGNTLGVKKCDDPFGTSNSYLKQIGIMPDKSHIILVWYYPGTNNWWSLPKTEVVAIRTSDLEVDSLTGTIKINPDYPFISPPEGVSYGATINPMPSKIKMVAIKEGEEYFVAGTATYTDTEYLYVAKVTSGIHESQTIVQRTGDIIVLKVPQNLQPITYNSAAGFTVTENGVDVPVTRVEVKDGTDGWPFSEVWLYLQHPVTMGSDVVVRYNPDPNYPLTPIDGGTVTVPADTPVINHSTVPLTLERSTVVVQPGGNVVYVSFPTKVKMVEYQGSAGYTIYSGGTPIQVTRVVTDGNGAYLYLEHPVPQGETVTVSYTPVQGQEITTVTGTPLSGTTNPVTVVNDTTSSVVIYEAPVVSEDGRTVAITAPSDLQDVIYEGNAGFRVFVGDQEIPVVRVEVKDNKIILYLGVPLIGGQVPEISYTPVEGQPIETSNGTPISSIDNLQGINQSTLSLDRITVEPNSISLLEGEPQHLTVTAHYSDGSAVDVTTLASYQTDNSEVATVSNDGLATGVKAGKVTVTVTYEGKMATVPVTVEPILSSITVSPNPISIAKGQSQGITVTATYSDGSTKDVTGEVNFQVEDATIANVTNGVVKGLTQGNTQITVVYKDKSATVPVMVTEAVVSKLEAAPNPISIPKGNSQQLTVIATYSDGSRKDITGEASYQIADSLIAIINSNSVKGLAEGNTNLTITYQGQTVTVPVMVTQPVITGLQVVPNPVSIAKGESQQLQVTANYSDGSSSDITGEALYQVGDSTIANVNNGKVTGLAKGSTQVTVSYQGQEVQVPVAVTDPVVTGLKATPNPVSMTKGDSQQLTVTATYSDGSTKEVTQEASYQSENDSVATVDKGLVRGVTQGNTNVTVNYQGQSIQVPVTVTAPILVGLTAEPSQVNLEKGQSQKLIVKAEYSDGSVVDVSDAAIYQVADSSIASITNGIVKGEAPGSTLVTASYQGKTVQVPVTVTAPVLTGLTVTPQSVSLEEGKSQKLTVTANYSDGSTKDVTAEASYQSGNNAIAVVNNGVVTGIKQGNTQVVVSYQGKTVQVPVTVTPPPVTQIGISIIPNPIQIFKYGSVRLQVMTVMSDGSTKDVTMAAQFTSSNTSIATVKSNGVVYGKNNGQTSIIVTYNGKEYEIPVIVGQIPVITKDKPQSQTPVVIYPEKQDNGTPIIVYPQS